MCLAAFRAAYSRCPRDGSPLTASRSDPLIGTTLADRYVVEALVGEGAMGLVYRAHHARLSRRFALKMMFGDVAAEPAMRMRFAQEADAASRLSHPNVVSVVDFGRTEHGLLYLAMDYAEGETLASVIRREGPLDAARVVALTRQMCRGLEHAHHAGLVHRDFKPANVMVAPTDEGGESARILDFGLAISEREGDRVARLTEHGLVVGTPIYIAPEQARDRPVDHRADLFALGVVMYEMLAGRTPFEGTGPEIAKANVTERPPALSVRNPQVTVAPELAAIVFRLLEKRPESRFQCADDVVLALDQLGRGGGRGASHQAGPDAGAAGSGRRRPEPRRPGARFRWGPGRGRSRRVRGPSAAWRWAFRGRGPRMPDRHELCQAVPARRGALHQGESAAPSLADPRADASAAAGAGAAPAVGPGAETPPRACHAKDATEGRAATTWGSERDQLPTVRLNRIAMRRVAAAAREMHRRGVSAATWLALATSGAVFAITGGISSEALERPAPTAMWIGHAAAANQVSQTAVIRGARRAAAVEVSPLEGLDHPLRRGVVLVTQWAARVPDAIGRMPAVIEGMEDAARGQIGGPNEGKMAAGGARRCLNVQDAGPTGATGPSHRGHRARSAALVKCRGLEAAAESLADQVPGRPLGALVKATQGARPKEAAVHPLGAPAVVAPTVAPATAQLAE